MDIAGLGIGIAGLAGLFSASLDIIERVDYYKDFGVDLQVLTAQFEADQVLYRQWGLRVGLSGGPGGRRQYHTALDNPSVSSAVNKILQSIEHILGDTDDGLTNDDLTSQPASSKYQRVRSRRGKISWSLRGRNRFVASVQSFSNLVQRLYDLVPPYDPSITDLETQYEGKVHPLHHPGMGN